jgi:phosphatidate cytidylyltransferase
VKTEILKRIVTAVVLGAATLAAILLLRSSLFVVTVAFVSAAAAWEWCHLGREKVIVHWASDTSYIFLVGAAVPILFVFAPALPWVVAIGIVWWVSIAVLVMCNRTRLHGFGWQAKKWHALLIILPAAVAITGLHSISIEGRWYVLACMLIVWTTDVCAYMVGRLYGKTLLAPAISPAKTVEGVGGGFIGALIVGLILHDTLPTAIMFSRLEWMSLVFATSVFSVIGDLAESAYKRRAGVKDSGRLLPGHGGILDRIDSIFAATPVFAAGVLFATR